MSLLLVKSLQNVKPSIILANLCKLSSAATETKLKVGTNEINYLKVGDGPVKVLCMPGALGSIWTDFKPQLEGLDKSKFTILAWDPPGYGKSRPPNKKFSTNFYEEDADCAQEFMTALNINKYSVLGWSDGGITGLILAAKYPAAVEKLAVWGANSFILPTELEGYEKIRDVKTWSPRMREPMEKIYGVEGFPQLWSEWVDGMKNLYKAKNGDICNEHLKSIKCPVFILYGQKDPIVESCHVSHLHTNIDNSRIYLYPEGKHNIHLKYANDFNKRIEAFLLEPSKL